MHGGQHSFDAFASGGDGLRERGLEALIGFDECMVVGGDDHGLPFQRRKRDRVKRRNPDFRSKVSC